MKILQHRLQPHYLDLGPQDRAPAMRPSSWRANTNRRLAAVAAPALLLAACWLLTRPYRGIVRDAEFYTAQALHHLDPGAWDKDLFFRFGSQDAFSLFTLIFAPLVGTCGPAGANEIAFALGSVLWIVALAVLMQALVGRGRNSLLIAALAVAMPGEYGMAHVFSFGEGFVSPRLFSEAAVMLALAAFLRGALAPSMLALGVAMLLHPLVGLTGVAAIFYCGARRDRRWAFAAVGIGLAIAIAAISGVGAFARLLRSFDPEWLGIVRWTSPQVFVGNWSIADAVPIGASIALILAACHVASPAYKLLARAAAVVGVAGVLATILGADLVHNLLITDLQPWRALWLLTLLGNAGAGILLIEPARSGVPGRLCRTLITAGILVGMLERYSPDRLAPWLLLAGAILAWWELRRGRRRPFWLNATLATGGSLIIGASLVLFTMAVYLELHLPVLFFPYTRQVPPALPEAAGLLLLFVAVGLAISRASRLWARPGAALAASIVVFAGAMLDVDRRDDWTLWLESPSAAPILPARVAAATNIYWEDGLELLWFKLQRPSYYACLQGASSLFFRPAALEFVRRGDALSTLNTEDFGGENFVCAAKHDPASTGPRSASDVAAACRALPDLDLIVLKSALPDAAATSWTIPVAHQRWPWASAPTQQQTTYFIYACSDLNRA